MLTRHSSALGAALLLLTCVSLLALPAALPAPVRAADAPLDSLETIEKGRKLTQLARIKDSTGLWAQFDDRMREAMGDREKFDEVLRGMMEQAGKLGTCVDEKASVEGGYWMYRALCRFENSPTPLALVFVFGQDTRVAGFWVRPDAKPAPTEFLEYQTKTSLELPFHGEWTVFWGGRTPEQNYHVISSDQRFAYDLLVLREGGSHHGDGRKNADYHAFGLPIVAPAAGRVAAVTDGAYDNAPGEMNPRAPFGNGVVLDHGNGEYSVFAHFKRGSVRVKLDQEVAGGDTLGLCGNSGNSSEPHLHYHLQSGAAPGSSAGLPAFFVHYLADGKPVERGEPTRGQKIARIPRSGGGPPAPAPAAKDQKDSQ